MITATENEKNKKQKKKKKKKKKKNKKKRLRVRAVALKTALIVKALHRANHYQTASNSETIQDDHAGRNGTPTSTHDFAPSPVEWLTDNGSCYRANETRQFARMLELEPKNTAVRSPESNGIAESFVKTIKRDYISIMPKPDGLMAAKNLAEAFEHYNEWHPHSALDYARHGNISGTWLDKGN